MLTYRLTLFLPFPGIQIYSKVYMYSVYGLMNFYLYNHYSHQVREHFQHPGQFFPVVSVCVRVCCEDIFLFQHHSLKRLSFTEYLVNLCQKSIDLCGSVWTVWFIHLILMIIPQSWLLLLEVRKVYSVSSSTIFLFIKVILAVLGPLHFCINFRTSYSISTIKPDRILVRIARMDRLIQEN